METTILDHKLAFSDRFSNHHQNTEPFDNRTQIYHLNTKLVWYSDAYCTLNNGQFFKVHTARTFTGDDLENSLKNVDNVCLKIRNAKYKKAILQAKLANLQKVSLRQEKLFQEVINLTEQKHQVHIKSSEQAV